MNEFSQSEREEIWFARVMMIIGVKEAMDVLVNLATILKVRSGLPIVASGADDGLAFAYLISSAITGGYLLAGGSLLSWMAYGRRAPRAYLFADVSPPNWRRCLSIAFRAWGGFQIILAVTSIALAVYYTHWPIVDSSVGSKRLAATQTAWILEHVLIGFLLLAAGGRIARFLIRTEETS